MSSPSSLSSDPLQRLLDAERARELRPLDLAEVAEKPGIFTAWILDPEALRDLGITGNAPQLLYVGKTRSLVDELRKYLLRPLPVLASLLAARGHCLLPLSDWYHPWDTTATPTPTPLGEVSRRLGCVWQQRHVRWIWEVVDGYDYARLDATMLAEWQPALNSMRRGRGFTDQIFGHNYERARARWLWHASWAASALRDALMYDDEQRHWAFTEVDEHGFPFPGVNPNYGTRPFRPTRAEVAELLHEGARHADPVVRDAVNRTREEEEFAAWWAAHCGAEFLPEAPVTIEEAIGATLRMEPETIAPSPLQLPAAAHRDQVIALGRMLSIGTD